MRCHPIFAYYFTVTCDDRLKVPGMGNMIMLFKAKDIKTMYSSDGRIPLLPGFDNFEYARAVTLKHRFPTCGLISNKVTSIVTFDQL